jgi:outer membrane protein TolC
LIALKHSAAPLALLLIMLAGCASYVPQPLSADTSALRFAARSFSNPGLQRFLVAHAQPANPARWDVNALTLAALYFQPDLAVLQAQQQLAATGVGVARQRPNPSLDFSPAYNSNALAGMSPWILGGVLNLPLETAGRRADRISEASALADAARLDSTAAAWQVRSQVRRALLDDAAARQAVTRLQQALALQQQVRAAVQRRFAAGDAARPELDAAQAAVTDAQLQLTLATGRVAATQVALAAAIGVPVSALEPITLSFDAFDRVPPATLPSAAVQRSALTRRADLLAALARYAASESALQLAVAQQYPNLQIGPGYKWDQGANKWSLGISLTLPLFNHNQAQIAQARAQREVAAAQFLALQAHAIAQTERALADYRAAVSTLADAQDLVATQQARAAAAQRAFSAGDTDRSMLARARLQTLTADGTHQAALMQAQRAAGALEDALQQPLTAVQPSGAPT